ncbi:MAG: helix-turn-helix transcriptional regulator [Acidimicrobiia bacterium]
MRSLQLQARALGDPTRHQIFQHVASADAPVGVAQLTERFGLNHNAIRQHLAKLVDAGLLVEAKAPAVGRGRPRLVYTLQPTVESRWGPVGPYERLALWLTEMVRTGDAPVVVGRRAGEADARLRAGSADPVTELVGQMNRLGFDPVASDTDGHIDVTLLHCPFASTALADPDTVCSLHLGMAQGFANTVGGLVVDDLERHDPRTANCRLRCHVDETQSEIGS